MAAKLAASVRTMFLHMRRAKRNSTKYHQAPRICKLWFGLIVVQISVYSEAIVFSGTPIRYTVAKQTCLRIYGARSKSCGFVCLSVTLVLGAQSR
eukprot:11016018-Alexandrium_andersonii.AAC.1